MFISHSDSVSGVVNCLVFFSKMLSILSLLMWTSCETHIHHPHPGPHTHRGTEETAEEAEGFRAAS